MQNVCLKAIFGDSVSIKAQKCKNKLLSDIHRKIGAFSQKYALIFLVQHCFFKVC